MTGVMDYLAEQIADMSKRLHHLETMELPISNYGTTIYSDTDITAVTGVWKTLPFNAEVSDDLGWHSTTVNNDRITVNAAGRYQAMVQFTRFYPHATGVRKIRILDSVGNTWNEDTRIAISGEDLHLPLVAQRYMAANAYIYCQVWQSSGGDLDIWKWCKLSLMRLK